MGFGGEGEWLVSDLFFSSFFLHLLSVGNNGCFVRAARAGDAVGGRRSALRLVSWASCKGRDRMLDRSTTGQTVHVPTYPRTQVPTYLRIYVPAYLPYLHYPDGKAPALVSQGKVACLRWEVMRQQAWHGSGFF